MSWTAAGRPAHRFAEVGSTNDVARALAKEGAAHGTWVVADRQAAGRGRLGRSWDASPGESLLCSVVLRPQLPPAQVPLLCLAAAESVAALHPQLRIKWPNDVLLPDGRKVCGILAEAEVEGADRLSVVLGIGVNLTGAPPLPTAGPLDELVATPDREAVAVKVVEGLLGWCARLEGGDVDGLVAAWSARCGMWGAVVRVQIGHELVEGEAVRIDRSGTLWVSSQGELRAVRAGDVEVVRWASAPDQ